MDSSEYFCLYSKNNLVRISQSPGNINRWCVSLNGQVLADNFASAEDAAYCASRNDFPTDIAKERFQHIKVPSDISLWRTTPPEFPTGQTVQTPPDDLDRLRPRFSNN